MTKQKNFRFQPEQLEMLEEVKRYLNELHGAGMDMYTDTTALMYCIVQGHKELKTSVERKRLKEEKKR